MVIVYSNYSKHAKFLRTTGFLFSAVLLASCGSTVQWSEEIVRSEDGSSQFEIGGDEIGSRSITPQLSREMTQQEIAAPGEGNAFEAPVGIESRKSGISEPSNSSNTLEASPETSGRGYTSDEIYIGYGTEKGADAINQQAGAETSTGDHEAHAEAMAKYINDRGGIAGRRIALVFYDYKYPGALQNPEGTAQAGCEKWTNDNQVFAVLNFVNFGDETLISCLAQRETPLISMRFFTRPEYMYEKYSPYVYSPSFPSTDRLVPPWISRLAAAGYFRSWNTTLGEPGGEEPTKVGILSVRGHYSEHYTKLVHRELSSHGISVGATYECTCRSDSISRDMVTAVQRFKSNDVTHVIGYSSEVFLFSAAAEQQRYRPRYGLSSNNGPAGLQEFGNENQFRGSLGVGYIPTIDVDADHDPGDTDGAAQCRSVMRSSGQDVSKRQAFMLMAATCDGFKFLWQSIRLGGLSVDGVRRGAAELGSMPSALTFKIAFRGGRPDGADRMRDIAYRGACECFEYASGISYAI